MSDVGTPAETRTFTVGVSRFNERYVRLMIERTTERLGLRVWTRVRRVGWLRREITLTLHGPPEVIEEVVDAVQSVRQPVTGGGGAG